MTTTSTVTENPTSLREVLSVYNVYESGTSDAEVETSRSQTLDRSESITIEADNSWPSDWRRMPQYRPTSRSHRVADRPGGQNAAEIGIVAAMFTGVWIIGVRQTEQERYYGFLLTQSTVCEPDMEEHGGKIQR